MAKKTKKKNTASLMVDQLWATHAAIDGVKQAIMKSGDAFMVSEDVARDALQALMDITLASKWLEGQFQKEYRDAVDRRLEKERHE